MGEASGTPWEVDAQRICGIAVPTLKAKWLGDENPGPCIDSLPRT